MNQSRHIWALLMVIAIIIPLGYCGQVAAQEIRFAILMPAPAKIIHENWQPVADYLSKELGQPVTIVTPRDLEQAKSELDTMDFVYANSYLFNLIATESKVTVVAQMRNTANSIYSHGRFLVRNDSSINSISDLKGKKVALISRYGTGSYLAPRASLAKRGLDIEKDVTVEYTKNLKKAAYMVLLGEADTAVMCEINYEILSKKIDTGDLRFFDTTDTFPEAVIFTRHDPGLDLVKHFKAALLTDSDNRNRALETLHDMKIGSFIEYDPVVETRMRELLDEAGMKDLKEKL